MDVGKIAQVFVPSFCYPALLHCTNTRGKSVGSLSLVFGQIYVEPSVSMVSDVYRFFGKNAIPQSGMVSDDIPQKANRFQPTGEVS